LKHPNIYPTIEPLSCTNNPRKVQCLHNLVQKIETEPTPEPKVVVEQCPWEGFVERDFIHRRVHKPMSLLHIMIHLKDLSCTYGRHEAEEVCS